MKDGITTGGTDHMLLDELEKCFSATEEFNGDGMRIVTHFDRPRAAKLLDEFANRLAVGRG